MQNRDVKTESVHNVILKLLFLLCVENISWNYLAVFPRMHSELNNHCESILIRATR